MYVCNCNGITEEQIERAVRAGSNRVIDVYREHDARPVCGRCVSEIAEIIEHGERVQRARA